MSAGVCIVLTFLQDLVPGKSFYHTSWYAISLSAATAVVLLRARNAGAAIFAAGTALLAAGGLASGLLGPDTVDFVRSPGTTAQVPDLGSLQFPLADVGADPLVVLRRAGKRDISLRVEEDAFAGSFILRGHLRTVAQVDVSDVRGNHLTLTQPQNLSFLSPVLLFAQKATVAGKTLPVDSFAVPALHRTVKVILFDAAHPAVLFAVEDERGVLERGAMKIMPSGKLGTVDGLKIRSRLTQYPAVEVASAPHPIVLILGFLLVVSGALKNLYRW